MVFSVDSKGGWCLPLASISHYLDLCRNIPQSSVTTDLLNGARMQLRHYLARKAGGKYRQGKYYGEEINPVTSLMKR